MQKKDVNLALQEYIVIIQKERQLSDLSQYENIWQDRSSLEVIVLLNRSNDNKLRLNTLWEDYEAGRKFSQPSHKLMNSYTVFQYSLK